MTNNVTENQPCVSVTNMELNAVLHMVTKYCKHVPADRIKHHSLQLRLSATTATWNSACASGLAGRGKEKSFM